MKPTEDHEKLTWEVSRRFNSLQPLIKTSRREMKGQRLQRRIPSLTLTRGRAGESRRRSSTRSLRSLHAVANMCRKHLNKNVSSLRFSSIWNQSALRQRGVLHKAQKHCVLRKASPCPDDALRWSVSRTAAMLSGRRFRRRVYRPKPPSVIAAFVVEGSGGAHVYVSGPGQKLPPIPVGKQTQSSHVAGDKTTAVCGTSGRSAGSG
ncbi:hypothetical protein EYF80_030838 [Liparis tanakae]|uniref:Uncharacterized protein n=1 Tax=Liparis tanakae TaxID=230148 RepID=A0A4Z2H0Q0_9TELE|nr:hypothetical protein EYF80_030838 [Liparis tanakae]